MRPSMATPPCACARCVSATPGSSNASGPGWTCWRSMDPTSEDLPSQVIRRGVAELAARYDLPDGAAGQLQTLARLLADPRAPSALRDPRRILEDHLADSLVALELGCVQQATAAVDIGSGAGLPGLPLAIALPSCSFVLLESSVRK